MKVYSSPNLAMVTHLKNILATHEIASHVRGEFRGAAVGEIPPIECWPELWILEESQAEEAKKIIKKALESSSENTETWKCSNCKEEIESQFTACWKCGSNRPDFSAS